MRTLQAFLALAAAMTPHASAQVTECASIDGAGLPVSGMSAVLSGDGSYVLFASYAETLDPGDSNGFADIFLRNRVAGTTARVSLDQNGNSPDNASYSPAITPDARFVLFASVADDLVADDTNGRSDVFLRDLTAGTNERVSLRSDGGEAHGNSSDPSVSVDGRYVCFVSDAADLVANDTNRRSDLFVHDRQTGATNCASVDANGNPGNDDSREGEISADGRFVVFTSFARNLVAGDTNRQADIFLRDLAAGVTTRLSLAFDGQQADNGSFHASLSADGALVVFESYASNLVAGDANQVYDVFLRDVAAQTTVLLSRSTAGGTGNGLSQRPKISADGNWVAFQSNADDLVAGDHNLATDIFLLDRSRAILRLVSLGADGAPASGDSTLPALSADGHAVAFQSYADDLVVGDVNATEDVFVHALLGGRASATSYGAGYAGTLGVPSLAARTDPVLGTSLAVDVGNSAGAWTIGFLLVGTEALDQLTDLGGVLLVAPTLLVPIALPTPGARLIADLPYDAGLADLLLLLQVLEADPGASAGFSFTPGLELRVGF